LWGEVAISRRLLQLKEGKKPIIINVMHWIFMPHLLVGQESLIFPILLLMVAVWKLPKDWSALEE
jgi:hypothetical protein